jgi:anti-anti-sigma factor
MQITLETFGKVLVAHTPNELIEDTAAALLGALSGPIGSGQVNVALQMDGSEIYDSAGLTALLDLQDLLRERGGKLVVSGLDEVGRKIFEITRLDRRFDLYESVIDAVSSFA